jgi:cytochrome c6
MMNKQIAVWTFLTLLLLTIFSGMAQAGNPMKGRGLYADRCAGCHGSDGLPQVTEVPNFKMGQGLMTSDQQMLTFIRNGKGVMPGFKGVLTDTEILDIIAHVRTFF